MRQGVSTGWRGAGLAGLLLAGCAGLLPAAAPPRGRTAAVAGLERQIAREASAGKFDQAARLAREVVALRLRWQGEKHWQTVDARREAQRWQRLAALPMKDRTALTRAYESLSQARQLRGQGRLVEAERAARQAVALCREVLGEEDSLSAEAYQVLARLLHAIGRYADAEALLVRALAIQRRVLGEEHPTTASSWGSVANLRYSQGKYAEALSDWETALAISRKALGDDHADLVIPLNNLGVLFQERGEPGKAVRCYEQALTISRESLGEQHPRYAETLDNLARALDAQGRHVQAQPLYERALTIRRQVLGGNHPATAASYFHIAANLDAQGKHASAQPLHQMSLAYYRRSLGERHPDTAASYDALAANLSAQGKFAEALPLFEKALQLRRQALGEEHPLAATSYNNVAANLAAQNRHALAQPLLEKALALRRKVLGEHHPLTAASYGDVAGNLAAQGEHARAQPLYEKALAIRKKTLGEDHPDTATGYDGLAANLAAQARLAAAQPLYEKALAIRKKTLGEDHPRTAESCNHLAVNLWRQGQVSPALRLLQASLPGQEAARAGAAGPGFSRQVRGTLSARLALAVGLARLGQPHNAFRHAEVALAATAPGGTGGSLTRQESARLAGWSARLGRIDASLVPLLGYKDLPAQRRDRREQLVGQRREVLSRWAHLTAAAAERQVLPLAEIQPGIPDDAALAFWLDVEAVDEHWACVVRREGAPAWVRLTGSGSEGAWTAADRQLASRFSRLASRPEEDGRERDRVSAALRRQRLDPLRSHLGAAGRLPAARRLLVACAGQMASVPLEALSDTFRISYIPSGTALARLKRAHRPLSASPALAVGDPTFTAPGGRPSVARLPATRREVETLSKLAGNCTVLVGSRASEQALDQLARSGKLKAFRLIHLATHGVGDPARPERSALLLARDRLPDQARQVQASRRVYTGELTAGTVLGEWQLDADLVVLSACASGRGAQAEGIPPFARAFLQAGARRVVLPRWDVSDAATLLLVERFYDRLLASGQRPSPAQALDEARSWLRALPRKEAEKRLAGLHTGALRGQVVRRPLPLPGGDRPFAHPFYWAGFTLFGDPD
jgi:CHAT domain-containing protein/tetratricopeptide (TPR) repeat protein